MTPQEQKLAKEEIARNLGISESDIEYKTLSFGIEKRVFECFFVKTKKKLSISNSTNLANYPLVFENCDFDSFQYSSLKIPNVLSFRQCKIKKFWALSVKFKSFFEMRDCEIEKIEIYGNSVFEDSVSFEGTKFRDDTLESKQDLKILFYYVEFKKNVYFNKAYFETKFAPSNIIFHQRVDFSNAKFEKECDFKQVDFEKDVNFDSVIFENYTDFKKINFNNANFSFSKFEYVDFSQAKFQGDVNFSEAIFNEVPNFSQAIFKENLNLVNAKLNFDFKNLKEKIQEEYNNYKEERPLENFANNFRDSFRIFKNVLIKDNNLLDASNFHKVELYCKEIELKAIWDKRGSKEINEKEIQTNMEKFTKFIDSLLLGFYRKLSDHHTDFLRVFNNLILLIALYSLFVFMGGYKIGSNNNSLDTHSFFTEIKKDIINHPFIQQNYNYILIFLCVVWLIGFVIILYGIFKNIKKDFKIIKNIILKDVLKSLSSLFMYLLVLLCVLIYLNIYIPKGQDNFGVILNIGIFFLFFIFYFWLICLDSIFFREILICISYIIVSIAIGVNIAILNPFIGKLVDSEIETKDPLFIVITFVYTILTALVLFSLQKTFRKKFHCVKLSEIVNL